MVFLLPSKIVGITPVLRLIREATMESNNKYSDKEGTDPRDLSRAREGSSDRAFLANRRIVSNRPESRYENVTEKSVGTQLNRSLIAKITLDFSTKSHIQRAMMRSAQGSKPSQWRLYKHHIQDTHQTANQSKAFKATSQQMVQSQRGAWVSINGASRSLSIAEQCNRGIQREEMGRVKPKQPHFRKRGSTYSSREMEEEYEEFDKRDRGQRDMDK